MTDQPADAQGNAAPSDLAGEAAAGAGAQEPYRVLARKYRPASFDDLIGQDALVRTLTNAIESDRLAQAYVLTGVRGVGKTTTARIIARALNCIGADGTSGATARPCGVCANCVAIAADRHVDVIEMDAASRTGIDDIRELIESVRYRPVQARKKVYIVDEVHMLSKQAFNGLLKTLEEPPAHVVFIFATTEIRKVPVTVLSRCQRFDLRRVEQEVLKDHFARVAKAEGIEAEDTALAVIARAADGSVRDGLSLLDQAIALGDGRVAEAQVRDMLGLADRIQVLDLFEAVMRGRAPEALGVLGDLHNAGADPGIVLQDLLELTHLVTKGKLAPATLEAAEVPEAERVRGKALAEALTLAALTRTWQILLKGLEEVRTAPSPLRAAEMVLIRLAYASDLPSPADLVARLSRSGQSGGASPAPTSGAGEGGAETNAVGRAPGPSGRTPGKGGPRAALAAEPLTAEEVAPDIEQPAPKPRFAPSPGDFAQVLALLRERRETILANHLAGDVHLVRFERGRIEVRPSGRMPRSFAGDLSRVLQAATDERWVVTISQEKGVATLREQARELAAKEREILLRDPLVQAVMETFPGARLCDGADAPAMPPPEPTSGLPPEPPPATEWPEDVGGEPLAFDEGDRSE